MRMLCSFVTPFETNDALCHSATCGGSMPYSNPHLPGQVVASASSLQDGRGCALSLFVQHTPEDTHTVNMTMNAPGSWMAVDLGEHRSLHPTHYCLRRDGHGSAYYALLNWDFQGLNDGEEWTTLRCHENDSSSFLEESGPGG